jgi:hypothetical protein
MKFKEITGLVALPKVQNVGGTGSNTVHPDWPSITVDNIKMWKEFDDRTFAYLYDPIWNLSIDFQPFKAPPTSMTFITGEDSVVGLLWAVFQVRIGNLFKAIESKLERIIWLGPGSLCNLGSNVTFFLFASPEQSLLNSRSLCQTLRTGLVH